MGGLPECLTWTLEIPSDGAPNIDHTHVEDGGQKVLPVWFYVNFNNSQLFEFVELFDELSRHAEMAESLGSDLESDASSADGGGPTSMTWSHTTTGREQLTKRVDSLQQENRVLKMELDTFRYKCRSLEEENRELKKARVTIVSPVSYTHLTLPTIYSV